MPVTIEEAKNKPKEPGFYWYLNKKYFSDPALVRVFFYDVENCLCHSIVKHELIFNGAFAAIDALSGEWSEKLKPTIG